METTVTKQHKSWILPYLDPVFTLRDFYEKSLRETVHCRAYLNRLVKQGRLVKLRDDVYAKEGWHTCSVFFQEGRAVLWGNKKESRELHAAAEGVA